MLGVKRLSKTDTSDNWTWCSGKQFSWDSLTFKLFSSVQSIELKVLFNDSIIFNGSMIPQPKRGQFDSFVLISPSYNFMIGC